MGKKRSNKSQDFNQRISLVMKSGKYVLGHAQACGSLRGGRAKLVVIASNTSPIKKAELEYMCLLSKTPVHMYNGTNLDLGTACGKHFRSTVMTVTDAGDSDIVAKRH